MVFRLSGRSRSVVAGLLCSVALLVALSACASGSGESAPKSQTGASAAGPAQSGESAASSQTGAPTGPAQEIKVKMGDFFFEPSDITIKAGAVRFIVTNTGATAHRFAITGNGFDATTRNVGAGRGGVLEVTIPAGSYKLFCSLDEHEARGAVGKLTVQ